MVAVIAVTLGVFTRLGTYTPWSPVMSAWSGDPIPPRYLQGLAPVERSGAVVFQNMQCRNCHSVGGAGGMRGPDLDAVATRLTEAQLVRQVVQGGGNMPAYGNTLSADETTALVDFLKTLRGKGLAPARNAQGVLAATSEVRMPEEIKAADGAKAAAVRSR
jgi:ubiquinol-cytochrome c reductase cytochrome b subunit